jgi:hypothetical protein
LNKKIRRKWRSPKLDGGFREVPKGKKFSKLGLER